MWATIQLDTAPGVFESSRIFIGIAPTASTNYDFVIPDQVYNLEGAKTTVLRIYDAPVGGTLLRTFTPAAANAVYVVSRQRRALQADYRV